jgi:hypothetical protein
LHYFRLAEYDNTVLVWGRVVQSEEPLLDLLALEGPERWDEYAAAMRECASGARRYRSYLYALRADLAHALKQRRSEFSKGQWTLRGARELFTLHASIRWNLLVLSAAPLFIRFGNRKIAASIPIRVRTLALVLHP